MEGGSPARDLITAGTAVTAAAVGPVRAASPAAEATSTTAILRASPGRDGGQSVHLLEKINGKTNSVTHRVEVNGLVVHQHTTHVGKHGGRRSFPDAWTGQQTIGEP